MLVLYFDGSEAAVVRLSFEGWSDLYRRQIWCWGFL